MNILQTIDLCKKYGQGNTQIEALMNINLSIEDGTFTAIIGRSGSGKSTLLHVIGGLDEPTSGNVIIEGINLTELGDKLLTKLRRRKIGFVFQAYNLIPEFTVLENIYMPSYLDSKQPDIPYIHSILLALGIVDKSNVYPAELSGGEQQRVAIARAMSTKPAILIADEPTGNLDVKSGEEFLDFLKIAQNNFKQTIILATHDLSITRYANRIITLEDGSIVSDVQGDSL